MLIFRAVFIFPTTISSYLSVCFLNQRTRLSTAVTVRKLTLIQCYLLILRPHSDSASCPSNALDRSKTSQDHVLHLVVSLVSFSMEQLFSLSLSFMTWTPLECCSVWVFLTFPRGLGIFDRIPPEAMLCSLHGVVSRGT